MSQKTETALTYVVFAFITAASFFGMAYPLLNPGMYTEVLMNTHMIPLVQHHVDVIDCSNVAYSVIDPAVKELSCDKFVV